MQGGSGNARSIRARLVLADQLMREGDHAQAAAVYARVAESYATAGRVEEAVAIATRAQSLGEAWFTTASVGTVLEQLGQAALPLCTRGAEAHWRAGRVHEALQLYYQATQLDPCDAPALIRLAQAYQHESLYDEATATFVVASRRLLEQENDGDFIAVAEQLLGLDAAHADTLRELSRAYLRVGEPRRAVAKLTALMQVVPEDPAGYEILAQAFACIGKVDVALSVLTRLANELRAQAQGDQAAELLWRAAHWLPHDAAFQRGIAGLTADQLPTRVGQNEPAIESIREGVMLLGPEDIGQLDEDSGVYRDREGTNMLSLDDIAVVEDSLRARVPMTPQQRAADRAAVRTQPKRDDDDEPRTLLMDDRIPPDAFDRPPKSAPPTPPARRPRPPILTKQEGTIVLDLRDLAVVGESREESVVLDISDVEEPSSYRLPELIVDEESRELEVITAAPPPVSGAISPLAKKAQARAKPPNLAGPPLPPQSRAAQRSFDDAATLAPPGRGLARGRSPVSGPGASGRHEDEDSEPRTMIHDTAAGSGATADPMDGLFNDPAAAAAGPTADMMDGLFKKRRTGRDRSASLVDKLGGKAARLDRTPTRKRPQTSTAPQTVVPIAQTQVPPSATSTRGDTAVTVRPQSPAPSAPTRKAGVRWDKPSAPKRDKPT